MTSSSISAAHRCAKKAQNISCDALWCFRARSSVQIFQNYFFFVPRFEVRCAHQPPRRQPNLSLFSISLSIGLHATCQRTLCAQVVAERRPKIAQRDYSSFSDTIIANIIAVIQRHHQAPLEPGSERGEIRIRSKSKQRATRRFWGFRRSAQESQLARVGLKF